MKKLFLLGAAVCGLAASSFAAAEWHVYSEIKDGMTGNQQLTNAFAKAVSGDTITIHAGTYTFTDDDMMFHHQKDASGTLYAGVNQCFGTCLWTAADNLTIQGDPSALRSEIVLDGASVDGSAIRRQLMRLEGKNYLIKHLTFKGGVANTEGVVFRDGSQLNTDKDKYTFQRGGAIFFSQSIKNSNSMIEDCEFRNCFAREGGAVYNVHTVKQCVFNKNETFWKFNGCALSEVWYLYDSVFTENNRGCVRGNSVVMSNCVFTANKYDDSYHGLLMYQKGQIIDCVFSNNTSVAVYMHTSDFMPGEIRGCSFVDNTDNAYSGGIGGTIPCTSPITNCLFQGVMQVSNCTAKIAGCRFKPEAPKNGENDPTALYAMIAACHNVEDCVFDGTGRRFQGYLNTDFFSSAVVDCSFKRCRFENLILRWAYGFLNVRRMENCLITGFVQYGGGGAVFAHTDGLSADYVNCTIAVSGGYVGCMFVNTAEQGTITFKNSLFAQNQVVSDEGVFDFYSLPEDTKYYKTLKMDHSIFKAGNENGVVEVECVGCSNLLAPQSEDEKVNLTPVNPRFIKDGYSGTGEPFSVNYKSICVNAGINEDWMASGFDLAGNKRIQDRDGVSRVDIGCYECYDKELGTCIILR